MTTTIESRAHWDTIYKETPLDQTGWYEADPAVSLELIEHCGLAPGATVADIGCGNSTLIPALADRGYQDIVAVDISQVALDALRARLGDQAGQVRFVCDDLADPHELLRAGPFALWHDRAMLHFLTDAGQREAYRSTLEALVAPGGHAIIGVFADDGAERCSGLPVERYDEAMLDGVAGPQFERQEARRTTYIQPSGGLRPYVYARYRRRSS